MRSKYVFIFLFFIPAAILSQQLDIKSNRISLQVSLSAADTLPTQLAINFPQPNVIKELPIYSRDSTINITGIVLDNKKNVSLLIDGKAPDIYTNNKFLASTKLKPGTNNIEIEATDRMGHSVKKIVTVYQDKNADITPPEIDISSSLKSRGINVIQVANKVDSVYKISGTITDASGLYGVWVDNSPLMLDPNGKFELSYKNLPDTIKIKAIDKFGNTAQQYYSVGSENVIATQNEIITSGKYYALLIANQNYNDVTISDLNHPIADVKALANALVDNYTFDKSNIILLENPNRAKIIRTLDNLSKKITSIDNLIIFYAGHGVWDTTLQQGFWLPSDATTGDKSEWLSNDNIRDYILGIKSKHTLLVSDACFGGAIFKSREVMTNAPVSIRKIYDIPSRKAMTSGALTTVPDKSVFVKYIIERLSENQNKYLSAETLFYSIKDAVINNSPTGQTPEYGAISQAGDEGGGSFVFIHK